MTTADPPPGCWVREASHAPYPPTPLSRPFWGHRTWLRVVGEELGFLFDTLDVREIGGWIYLRVVPLIDKVGPKPPAALLPMLYTTVPRLRRRVDRAVEAVETDLPGQLVRRWHDTWRGELSARIATLREIDLEALTDSDLAEHYQAALALSADGSQIHFRLWGAVVVALGTLEFTCREVLGWPDGHSVHLLSGTSTGSTEPALALAELVAAARRAPAVPGLLTRGAPTGDVLAADAAFATAFAAYLRRFGCRALSYDLGDATLAERPVALLGLVRDQLDSEGEDRPERTRRAAEEALALADRVLAGRDPGDRTRFARDLARARAAYPVREDNELYTISTPLALLRLAALEIGRRLAARDQLDLGSEVFYLEVPEMLAALRTAAPARELVRRRRAERAWALAHPGPPNYGPPPDPPPPLDGLPDAARQVNAAFWWALEQIAAPAGNSRSHAPRSRTITGIPASPGEHRGRVRLVDSEAGFDALSAGDVLVCRAFPPVWSVLLATAGALVTDQGGPLSHGAIIAREFAVPAVVATGDATNQLTDGQIVTVNGAAGTVTVEP